MARHSRRQALCWLGAVGVGLTAGCSATDEPALTTTDETANASPGDVLWTHDVDAEVRGDLGLTANAVYVPADRLYAYSLSGRREWSYSTAQPFYESPLMGETSFVEDAVYVSTAESDDHPLSQWAGAVHAVEFDGARRWRFQLDAEPDSIALLGVGDQHAYVATMTDHSKDDGETLFAVDTTTGTIRWRTEIGMPTFVSPLEDAVCVGSYDDVRMLATADGSERWRERLADHSGGSLRPRVDSERVYVSTDDDVLYALDRSSGTERWTYEGDFSLSEFVVTETAVFVSRFESDPNPAGVAALDPTTGTERWVVDRYDNPARPKLLVDETLFAVTADWGGEVPVLAALDVSAGTEAWRRTNAGRHVDTIGDTVYTTAGNELVALGVDGTEQWRHGEHAAADGLLTGSERVFALDEDGTFTALRA